MLNAQLIEKEYGYIGDHVYVNSSLVGLPPERVKDVCRSFLDNYVANFNENIKSNFADMREDTKKRLAQLINARPEDINFTKNATEANSILAMGYQMPKGSNVIIVNTDYPNTMFPWVNAQRRGIKAKVVKSKNGQVSAKDIIAAMDENTKVVALAAVQSYSGCFVDLKTIGTECRKRGIVFAVDSVQALGRLNIDVQEYCIDYLTGSGYKGLMGTFGAGFIYCSPKIICKIVPPYASYQSTKHYVLFPEVETDFSEIPWHDDVRRLEAGHQNTYAIAAMGKGISLLQELGIKEIHKHIIELDDYLRERIKDLPLNVVQPEEHARRSGVIAILLPPNTHNIVRSIMQKYKIHLTLREGYMRICIGVFNTKENVDMVVKALKEFSDQLQSNQ